MPQDASHATVAFTTVAKVIHSMNKEFQQAYGTVVLLNAICKEAHLLGFHGGAATAAHKPLITQSNRTTRFRWCKALKHETSDGYKRVLDP
ncbi:hypothetical protein TNCV_1630831 [Trichonephila clavipes]|nr:hypothetical protein TNCV_1630831 [Trichonephila clavipes]